MGKYNVIKMPITRDFVEIWAIIQGGAAARAAGGWGRG